MGEIGKNYATLHDILQSKKCKEAGAQEKGREPGLKSTGSRKIKPPCPSPPLPITHWIVDILLISGWLVTCQVHFPDCQMFAFQLLFNLKTKDLRCNIMEIFLFFG